MWCTYKYLSSGPVCGVEDFTSIVGIMKTFLMGDGVILAGWWGVDLKKRFLMKHEFEPCEGARAFQQSCISIFNHCGILASMESLEK